MVEGFFEQGSDCLGWHIFFRSAFALPYETVVSIMPESERTNLVFKFVGLHMRTFVTCQFVPLRREDPDRCPD
jgi:hypothetical protein